MNDKHAPHKKCLVYVYKVLKSIYIIYIRLEINEIIA